jgi:hypothetical protein
MPGFLLLAALVIVLFCVYSLLFRKEAIRAFPNTIRYIFWGYFIVSILIVAWGLTELLVF